MKVELFNGFWTIDDVKNNPEKIFVYGDNNARVGKGGQAIIRDLPNTIGIRTKKGPSNKPAAFYNDSDYIINCNYITEDAIKIRSKLLTGSKIVFSKDGYGTGLARLKETAPKTYKFLLDILRDFFEFDNDKGVSWKTTPSYDNVNGATYIDFYKSNNDLLLPVNNSFFKEEYLSIDLTSYFDLIKNQKKVAFTSKSNYKKDTFMMLRFESKKEYLLVKTCCDSYDLSNFDKKIWSDCEGYNHDFIESQNTSGFFQTQFKYLCQISDDGTIFFDDDLFVKDIKDSSNKKVVGNPTNTYHLTEAERLKKELEELKLELENKNNSGLFKNPFKKSLKELLIEKNIYGEITKLPDDKNSTIKGDRYQVKVKNDYYYVVFKKHLLTNSIEILSASKKPLI
jgi:hypothetical protein